MPRAKRKPPVKPNDTKQAIKNILYLLKGYKLKLALTIFCAILSTVFSVIGPLFIGRATTIIFNGIVSLSNHTGTIDLNSLVNILIFVLILYVVSAIFTYLQSWLLVDISTSISYNLRKKLIDKVTYLSMTSLDNNKRGDILSRITNDVDSLQTGITSTFIQLITAIITIIGVFFMMLSINLWMTLAALIIIPVSYAVIMAFTKFSQKYFKKQLVYKGSVNAQIEETFTGHDIVRAFNQENDAFDNFKEDNDKWYTEEWKSQFFSSLNGPIMTGISNLAYVVIAVLGGIFVLEKTIAVGDILAFFEYIKNFTQPIQQITRVLNQLQTAMAAGERIFEFLDIDIEENDSDLSIVDVEEGISFEDVHFSYGDNDEILKGLSFDVKKGEKIAIIGETGAGKTTIVKLLMRFYDLNKGAIKIDGENINKYDKNSLRSLVGMVLQDTWLFSDTIRENIRYGDLDASDEDVVVAAKNVFADNFIRQLPDGYDTLLNEETDNISQGQKQLLTIARTILADRKILILDEATSSVDTRTEKLIQRAMDNLMEGKTSFIIAHRLSTIRDADKIIVLEHGRIIEVGTHEELLSRKGYYYNTLNSQYNNSI